MAEAFELHLTRTRAQIVIHAVEEDLRQYLTEWVLPHSDNPHGVFGPLAPVLERRALKDRADGSDPYVWVEYLDYADTYELLNRHSRLLPGEVSESLRVLTPRLQMVTRVRNRLAHSRRFDADDLDAVEKMSAEALALPLKMPKLTAVTEHMASDPA